MQTITAQQTSAAYTDATTIPGDDWEGLYVAVYNQTVLMQVRTMPDGHYQQGDWGDELKVAPSAFPIDRASGVRFRTNPATPASPGVVNAWAWKSAEPQIGAGVQITGTQAATGAITSSQMLTGSVDSAGSVVAGTGFSAVRTGTGLYTVAFTTAFAAAPVFVGQPVGLPELVLNPLTISASQVTLEIVNEATNSDINAAFVFLATATV